jgi:transcriptional regulator with XRE-family HTH domain
MTQSEIAERVGISQPRVSQILRKKPSRKRAATKRLVSWRAALTPAQVRVIRREYRAGKTTTRELSVRYGVSQSTISNILRGKVYKKVT